MGTFSVSCEIANIGNRDKSVRLERVLVDTGSEFTWAPRAALSGIGIDLEKKDITFLMANGSEVTRSVGFALIRVQDRFTVDEVVFAEDGDLCLLGARTLEGLNLRVDPAQKRLVAAGPLPAAVILSVSRLPRLDGELRSRMESKDPGIEANLSRDPIEAEHGISRVIGTGKL